MCTKPKVPEVPKVAPAPTRADAEFNAGQSQRKRLNQQSGVKGNIFTSALGDATYGENAVSRKLATLGA